MSIFKRKVGGGVKLPCRFPEEKDLKTFSLGKDKKKLKFLDEKETFCRQSP